MECIYVQRRSTEATDMKKGKRNSNATASEEKTSFERKLFEQPLPIQIRFHGITEFD
jgi:hypothetical protein